MRIVYCVNFLWNIGGVEHVTIVKANALAQIAGNEVWIVVVNDSHPPMRKIDERVHVVSLGITDYKRYWEMNRLQANWRLWKKRKFHKEKLEDTLNLILPDVVISTHNMEMYFLPFIKCVSNPIFIKEIHYTSNWRLLLATTLYTKFMAYIWNIIEYKISGSRYDIIVLLTNEDKERSWKGNDKVVVIPNPLTIQHNKRSALRNKTVITVGRLVGQKNFSSLIRTWDIVHQSHPDWHLEIWGEGKLKAGLQQQIKDKHLEGSIFLKGYTNDIIETFPNASIYVCSSHFEGLPLVLIEAMSCGLPIVSYACPCGPRDIISEGNDGFLILVGDEQGMADRINYLIEHETIRQQMGMAALEKSKQYATDIIIRKWMLLFHHELKNHRRI